MTHPADHDDPPPPDPAASLHSLLAAQAQSLQNLAVRVDSLEAGLLSLRHDLLALGERLSDLAEESQAVQSFGWDYLALVNRLETLEQRLAQHTTDATRQNPADSPPRVPSP